MWDSVEQAQRELDEDKYGSSLSVDDTPSYNDEGLNDNFRFNSTVTQEIKRVPIDSIVIPIYKKVSRTDTLKGLTGVVTEWGVVSPIHVLKLEEEDSYMLMSGLRRLYAGGRNNLKEINAIVWEFSDPEEGKQKAMLIGAMLDRSEKYRVKEIWEQMQLLEEVHALTPNFIEFLLGMQAGEAMKLKDVMLSGYEYAEIREKLMNNELTIDGAYKKLSNERKKENRLEKEDNMMIDTSSDPESLNPDDMPEQTLLASEDVKELLDLKNVDITDEEVDGINEMGMKDSEPPPTYDDKGNRTKLPEELRKAILVRDEFTCQCCGLGGQHRLSTLQVHHIVEVSQGGDNSEENLITVCMSCHTLIHTLAWGKLSVVVEDLSEDERKTFKAIIKYANVIIKAEKLLNTRGSATPDKEKRTSTFVMPASQLSTAQKAFNEAQAEKALEA